MKVKRNLLCLLIILGSIGLIGCSNTNNGNTEKEDVRIEHNTENNKEVEEPTGLFMTMGKVKEINLNPTQEECDCLIEGQLTKGTVLLEGEVDVITVINQETKIIKDNRLVDIDEITLDTNIEVKYKSALQETNPVQGIAETIRIITN